MNLGLDIGPTYPDTALSQKAGTPYVIENAKDATCCFFSLLKNAIENAVKKENLPNSIEYAISVPASFLTNQRSDLLESVHKAGISISESCLIDEPNAAFLSFFYDNINESSDLSKTLESKSINVLVYDFGAGTCDISILNVTIKDRSLHSKNIAISKFTALGGDNIDRDIAKQLAKKLRVETDRTDFIINERVETTVVSRLMPIAESLKIAMIRWLSTQGIADYKELKRVDHKIELAEKCVLNNKKENLSIFVTPSFTTSDFYLILSKYLDSENIVNNMNSVCAPIEDALSKSGIQAKDLYGVLFIGGSCENQLVRTCVMNYLPSTVKAIIPSDLRTHVSRGAALHSIGFHGCAKDFIEPIISEDINIVTSGNKLKCLIKASTPVPSEKFTLSLKAQFDGQSKVEIPVCLSSTKQMLGILKFSSKSSSGFKKDQTISVSGVITRDKTIEVVACVDGKKICSESFNPLSITETNEIDEQYLQALKQYRNERLKFGAKNITASTILAVIKAAIKADMHSEATEYSIELETLYDKYATGNNATNIAYHASCAGKHDLTKKYSKISVEREENGCSCYNYSLECQGKDEIFWLRKSLSYDPSYVYSLINLGKILSVQNNSEGLELLRKAFDILNLEFKQGIISCRDLSRFENLCNFLGIEDKEREIQSYKNSSEFIKSKRLNGKNYHEDALVCLDQIDLVESR